MILLPTWKNRRARVAIALLAAINLPSADLLAGEADVWRERMQPLAPQQYVCRKAAAPLVIDGKLDEAAWRDAPWTRTFADIEGARKPKPRFQTRAKLLWDDQYLYIAAELEEPHVWATLTNHDAVIFQDPDFEVFLDPRGHTQPYYEFEMNALNTTWDLRLDKPYQDEGKPQDGWEIVGAKTAVQIQGTLNQPADTDRGWTVELAFPWTAFSEPSRPIQSPKEGAQWRVGFSRVEWQITTTNGAYSKIPKTPEDNWVWSPQGVVDMHRPEMWGLVRFTSRPASAAVAVTPIPGKAARDLALEIYYAQRDFQKLHQRWATNLADLGWTARQPAGETGSPQLKTTPDGYECSVSFKQGAHTRTWRIRQQRLLTLDDP